MSGFLGNGSVSSSQDSSKPNDNGVAVLSDEELRLRIMLPGHETKSNDYLFPQKQSSGLRGRQPMILLTLWYIFSAFTLFANKFILSYLGGDPALLAMAQMFMCMSLGSLQLRYSCGLYSARSTSLFAGLSFFQMIRVRCLQIPIIILGTLRFMTLVLGLVALNYVAVSFTETVKSSAPLFTVLITRAVLGEKTGLYVNLSLVPIMAGLALCSATELSFNTAGFIAAICTNLSECSQNVYSKAVMSGERHKYGPAELQFLTSLASLLVQIPASIFLVDWGKFGASTSVSLLAAMVLNGAFFHMQSITEYALLEHINPVTHSVANTVKRALLIWLSIFVFGNPVTVLNGFGTLTVSAGVLLYNKARDLDAQRSLQSEKIVL